MSSHSHRLPRQILVALLMAIGAPPAFVAATTTDLADVPLASSSSSQVKPNVLFVLDDSGSMAWDYMPNNSSNNPEYNDDAVGFRNSLCNYVFYNPAVTYEIPKDGDGTNVYDADQTSFTGAYADGFYCYKNNCGSSTQSKTNISTSFKANSNDTGQAAYYWMYQGATAASAWTASTAYAAGAIRRPTTANGNVYQVLTAGTSGATQPTWPTAAGATVQDGTVVWISGILPTNSVCDTSVSNSSTGSMTDVIEICTDGTRRTTTCASGLKTALWKKVLVSSTSGPSSGDERQNFANWYSYYRTRMLMMKSSSGRALFGLPDSFRVGFMTIHPGTFDSNGAASGSVSSSKFLKVSDFNAAQRTAWYSKLYSQATGSATPLRTALSVAGRYFAGKNDQINNGMIPAQADDPVQYSCQQNFTILTTDGYWNDGESRALNGTSTITNQDGNISELDAYNSSDKKFAVSPRPIFDGATATYVYNTLSLQYQTASCTYGTSDQQRTVQYQQCSTPGNKWKRTSVDSGAHWTAWGLASSCTSDSSGSTRTQCRQYEQTRTSFNSGSTWSDWTEWSDTSNYCSTDNSGSSRRQCRNAYGCISNTWSNAQCTNTDASTTPLCRSTAGAWGDVASCSDVAQNGSGVATECQSIPILGYKIQYKPTTTSTTYPGPNQSGSIISGPSSTVGIWTDVTPATCYATAPSLPANGAVTGAATPAPPDNCLSGSQVWPCETSSSTGGSENTLADVAQYYYKTDLRTTGNCTGALGGTADTCANNVPSSGTGTEDDKANWQHMTTFTMGLGLSGTLTFSPTYKTDTTGTFANIRTGSTNWPLPNMGGDSPTNLDDLWHAAINGRGQYFSARDPDTVIDSLSSALSGISARVASAAAAATSNLEPVAGDNFAYTAKYVTQKWNGELEAHEINLTTGAVSGTVIWSAQSKLDAKRKNACDNRTIKLFRSGATNNLVNFTWNTYACDVSGNPTGAAQTELDSTEQANFGSTQVQLLSQYPDMTDGTGSPVTVDQRAIAPGDKLVNFLRGQHGNEAFEANSSTKLYRAREHILGDIINAQPVFVKAPFAEYTDSGYSAFKTAKVSRTPMVYVAANDGMLHAFYAGTSIADTNGGNEAWAFMPTMALSNLYKLASVNYATQHVFTVDGTPTAADIFDTTTSADCALGSPVTPSSCWKSILVGGLNKGGKGYYALDITDPATPKALWEFKYSSVCYDTTNAATKAATAGADCHIGYTFNNPIVGKLADGTWAVFVTSGYNNDDGKGYLYVLNAATGKIIYRISTGSGTATSPSGLNHINAWVDNALQNNTIGRVYGVDLDGKIWRFDVNDTIDPTGREATLLAQVVDGSGNPQSITTKPELAEVNGSPFIYVATGRYLGTTDLSTTQTQTVWAIKDPLTTTAVTSLRSTLGQRIITNHGSGTSSYRTIASGAGGCTAGNGWYIDLPDSGERVNIDIKLQLGTLVVPSNVPETNACNIGGYGWLNYFNFTTGCAVTGGSSTAAEGANSRVGQRLVGSSGTESLAVGTNIVRLPDGKTVVIATTSAAEQITFDVPFSTPPPVGKRVSWREVAQ